MMAVIVWSGTANGSAIAWCADSAGLAYISPDVIRQSGHRIETGSVVRLQFSAVDRQRRCTDITEFDNLTQIDMRQYLTGVSASEAPRQSTVVDLLSIRTAAKVKRKLATSIEASAANAELSDASPVGQKINTAKRR